LVLAQGLRSSFAAEANPLLNSWLAAQTRIQTWSAEVVQTRQLKTLAQPLTVTGRVWFAAPDRFRWELGDPPQTIAVRQPDQMLVIYPRLQRAEKYPLAGERSGPWKDALALLEVGFPRSQAELEARFKISGQTVSNQVCEVALSPKAAARRLMPRLKVAFATNDFSLVATELEFADGSRLRNEFRRARLNPPLADGLFTPPLGAGFTVTEPLAK
jgi:outer membrane lipoprotein-sorting protein